MASVDQTAIFIRWVAIFIRWVAAIKMHTRNCESVALGYSGEMFDLESI